MDKLKYFTALLVGIVSAYLKMYALLYGLVLGAIVFDLVTGCIAAIIKDGGLSSDVARKGFYKKIVLLIAMGFGTFLDVFIPYVVAHVGIELPHGLLLSSVVCVYIVINECISIIENIVRCTDRAMPSWILKLLKQAKDKMDENTENVN